MLRINPAIVSRLGATHSGICSTNHRQKGCRNGSRSDTPPALYLCSDSLFSWLSLSIFAIADSKPTARPKFFSRNSVIRCHRKPQAQRLDASVTAVKQYWKYDWSASILIVSSARKWPPHVSCDTKSGCMQCACSSLWPAFDLWEVNLCAADYRMQCSEWVKLKCRSWRRWKTSGEVGTTWGAPVIISMTYFSVFFTVLWLRCIRLENS